MNYSKLILAVLGHHRCILLVAKVGRGKTRVLPLEGGGVEDIIARQKTVACQI